MNTNIPKRVIKDFARKLHLYSDEYIVSDEGYANVVVDDWETNRKQKWLIVSPDELDEILLDRLTDHEYLYLLHRNLDGILKEIFGGSNSNYFHNLLEAQAQADIEQSYWERDYDGDFETQHEYLLNTFNVDNDEELLNALIEERIGNGNNTFLGGLYEYGYDSIEIILNAYDDGAISPQDVYDCLSRNEIIQILSPVDGEELELCDYYCAYRQS